MSTSGTASAASRMWLPLMSALVASTNARPSPRRQVEREEERVSGNVERPKWKQSAAIATRPARARAARTSTAPPTARRRRDDCKRGAACSNGCVCPARARAPAHERRRAASHARDRPHAHNSHTADGRPTAWRAAGGRRAARAAAAGARGDMVPPEEEAERRRGGGVRAPRPWSGGADGGGRGRRRAGEAAARRCTCEAPTARLKQGQPQGQGCSSRRATAAQCRPAAAAARRQRRPRAQARAHSSRAHATVDGAYSACARRGAAPSAASRLPPERKPEFRTVPQGGRVPPELRHLARCFDTQRDSRFPAMCASAPGAIRPLSGGSLPPEVWTVWTVWTVRRLPEVWGVARGRRD